MASAAARCVAGANRQIDHDSAGGLMLPGLREGQHFRALCRSEFAAIGPDEDFDGVVGFADRDRMTQPVIGGNIGDGRDLRLVGVAAANNKRTAGDDCRANCEPRGAAALGDHCADSLHRRLLARRINRG
jgi:hypothetical protein